MTKAFDSVSFRHSMGNFTTGVAVATMQDPELGAVGLTINSLTSVSLDPPLLLFCLEKAAHLHQSFCAAEHFAINILAADQQAVSQYFADRLHNAKPENLWHSAKSVPVLQNTMGWLICRRHALYEGGDHTIIVGEVIDLHNNAAGKAPLAYYQGRYRNIQK